MCDFWFAYLFENRIVLKSNKYQIFYGVSEQEVLIRKQWGS